MKQEIYINLCQIQSGIAVLIDPDKSDDGHRLKSLLKHAQSAGVDLLLIGGSTVTRKKFLETVAFIKSNCGLPLVIFPGSAKQLSPMADGILYLSLVSGRNPDYLIGQQVESAEELFDYDLEIIPTAYILIDGGVLTNVARVSQTKPISPSELIEIRKITIASKFLGKKAIYLDAGSGAIRPVPDEVISTVKEIELPIIVGGGIQSVSEIQRAHNAGANLVVIGNILEKKPAFIKEIASYIATRTNVI